MKSKVYFMKEITPENVVRMYEALNIELKGKVAVKVHSGEKGNFNFLKPEFWKPVIDKVGGRVVECNTAYGDRFVGVRDHTDSHRKLLEEHGWSKYFDVDLMDAEGPDVEFDIPAGKQLKKNYVGKNLKNYDSMLILAHFKGHPNGGYGGALKQLSIGCASKTGKILIHTCGKSTDPVAGWDVHASDPAFCEGMAEAASTVVKYFNGNMAFINVMKNLSVDCDCVATPEPPCMKDIGILSSLDPVAIDQACLDLVVASDDPGKEHFMERVNSKSGFHTIEHAAEMGYGSREYELIKL
ncbi:MAG: DUF362 domain-containing protein [Candidatus Methanomethylophilaceae archaeon]|nr:DUF362 domain-containing protein [Candidatus Methanomethylophilaceae archaeon]